MKKYEKYKETEKVYRNRADVKAYQKEYQKYYRMFCKYEISLDEFNALKPKKSDFMSEKNN